VSEKAEARRPVESTSSDSIEHEKVIPKPGPVDSSDCIPRIVILHLDHHLRQYFGAAKKNARRRELGRVRGNVQHALMGRMGGSRREVELHWEGCVGLYHKRQLGVITSDEELGRTAPYFQARYTQRSITEIPQSDSCSWSFKIDEAWGDAEDGCNYGKVRN
jgi:hypothetical protein